MDRTALHELLARGPLLADGGTGTSLLSSGTPPAGCVEAWNLEEPARVEELHRAFVRAGARLVITNTFGANRVRLGPHGLGDRVGAINEAAVAAARRAGAPSVGGSMGPLGIRSRRTAGSDQSTPTTLTASRPRRSRRQVSTCS